MELTSKDRAKELVNRFKYRTLMDKGFETMSISLAKQCALICVDEILEALEHHTWQNKDWIKYYKEVKEEINKL